MHLPPFLHLKTDFNYEKKDTVENIARRFNNSTIKRFNNTPFSPFQLFII